MKQAALILALALGIAFAQNHAATQLWMHLDAVTVECPSQFRSDEATVHCASWPHGFALFQVHVNQLVTNGWEGLEPAGPWELNRAQNVYSRAYYNSHEVTRLVFAGSYFSEWDALILFATF